ncbi:unnamed protein product, partial [Musa hybrid cultivar]
GIRKTSRFQGFELCRRKHLLQWLYRRNAYGGKGSEGEGPEAVGRAVAASIWPSFGPIRIEKVELRTRLSMVSGDFGPFCCYGQMQLKKEDDMYGSFLCMSHLYVCAFGH